MFINNKYAVFIAIQFTVNTMKTEFSTHPGNREMVSSLSPLFAFRVWPSAIDTIVLTIKSRDK